MSARDGSSALGAEAMLSWKTVLGIRLETALVDGIIGTLGSDTNGVSSSPVGRGKVMTVEVSLHKSISIRAPAKALLSIATVGVDEEQMSLGGA